MRERYWRICRGVHSQGLRESPRYLQGQGCVVVFLSTNPQVLSGRHAIKNSVILNIYYVYTIKACMNCSCLLAAVLRYLL